MTVFDLDNEEKGAWFDMEGGGRVQIQVLSPSDWIKINKATVKRGDPIVKEIGGGKYQLFEREILDRDLQIEMCNDMSIVTWENLFDGKNNPIPCTKENKARLMFMKDNRFRDFVNEKIGILNGIETERKETAEKN